MWQPPPQGKSQQGQIDACHQPRLLPQLDLRNRILSVHLPSQCQRPVLHSLGELPGGASSAALLPETSLLTVLMYRAGALPVSLLRCSVGAFLVLNLSCFFSPRSPSSLSPGVAPSYSFSSFIGLVETALTKLLDRRRQDMSGGPWGCGFKITVTHRWAAQQCLIRMV